MKSHAGLTWPWAVQLKGKGENNPELAGADGEMASRRARDGPSKLHTLPAPDLATPGEPPAQSRVFMIVTNWERPECPSGPGQEGEA